ncbi:MAG: ABC transporter permease [Rhodospirillaceae bacterium]|nr:ABC transporter permease [Rhodospirillaceae bacterium]
MLRVAPVVTLLLLILPIAAGLAGTVLPSFGYLPALGGTDFSLGPWRDLLAYPGFGSALRLSIVTGLAATMLSFAIAVLTCAAFHGAPGFRRLQAAIAPILAMPHSALAIGFAFLIAPSGWLARLAASATGADRPAAIVTVQDEGGLALIAGLLLKEVPYLLLMIFAALNQTPARHALAIARSLGYGGALAWIKVVLPRIYPQIRLPIYAVLAFSLSVVDVALILGPGNPPPLGPLALRWFSDPLLLLYFPAAAAASVQLALLVAAITLWRIAEVVVARAGRKWIARGGRGLAVQPFLKAGGRIAWLLLAVSALSLLAMGLWSVAESWRFPDLLPTGWSLATWTRQAAGLWWPARTTMVLALVSTLIAMVLALACLENEQRRGLHPGIGALWLLYTPLLVPQIAFLFGTQIVLIRLDLDGTWTALVWSHLLFVLPYVFLSLADPWRNIDPRLIRTAACLGASPLRILFAVKLPMMLRPLLAAAAVGFAVSVGLYLPTLFAGNGRFATLTTEAVTLAGGADRRIIGIYALLQALLPLLIYAIALAAPPIAFRHRRALAVAS